MAFPIQRYNAHLPQFGVWKDGFTEEEVEKIVFLEKLLEFSKGRVGSSTQQKVDEEALGSRRNSHCQMEADFSRSKP